MRVEILLRTGIFNCPPSVTLTFEVRTKVLCATRHPIMVNIYTK